MDFRPRRKRDFQRICPFHRRKNVDESARVVKQIFLRVKTFVRFDVCGHEIQMPIVVKIGGDEIIRSRREHDFARLETAF